MMLKYSANKVGFIRRFSSSPKEIFKLDPDFVSMYEPTDDGLNRPRFGFNGIGEIAYIRSYARVREDLGGRQERWHETIERVVDGCFTM